MDKQTKLKIIEAKLKGVSTKVICEQFNCTAGQVGMYKFMYINYGISSIQDDKPKGGYREGSGRKALFAPALCKYCKYMIDVDNEKICTMNDKSIPKAQKSCSFYKDKQND